MDGPIASTNNYGNKYDLKTSNVWCNIWAKQIGSKPLLLKYVYDIWTFMAPTISQDIIEFYIVSKIDETGEVNGRIKKCYAKKSHFSSACKKNDSNLNVNQ